VKNLGCGDRAQKKSMLRAGRRILKLLRPDRGPANFENEAIAVGDGWWAAAVEQEDELPPPLWFLGVQDRRGRQVRRSIYRTSSMLRWSKWPVSMSLSVLS
jgi:hypothetical protein